jgi:hypothetical protein
VIHDKAFVLEQKMQPPIAKPSTHAGELTQTSPQHRIVRSAAAIAHRCAIRSNHRTRPPLADRKRNSQVSADLTSWARSPMASLAST